MTFSFIEFSVLLAAALTVPVLCHFDTVVRERAIFKRWFLRRVVAGAALPAIIGGAVYLGFSYLVIHLSPANTARGTNDITFLVVFALVCGFVSASVEATRRRTPRPAPVPVSR